VHRFVHTPVIGHRNRAGRGEVIPVRTLAGIAGVRTGRVVGVIFNGDPPFSLWEHPSGTGKIPPHRSDAGSFLLAECFGCATVTLVKDVDGLYDRDPKEHPSAKLIEEITVAELADRNLPTLPFDRILLELLGSARQVTRFQIINGLKPELLEPALRGERVGTIVRRDASD
jgi:molybdenum storage protein